MFQPLGWEFYLQFFFKQYHGYRYCSNGYFASAKTGD
ncbi:mCG148460 [Mus musculus]|nr:mCG148460 [Mus musculus]